MKILSATLAACTLATAALADTSDDALHNISHFFEGAQIVAGPSLVDCTLSGGTETSCFSITVKSEPNDYTPGPWCPTSLDDGPEAGGIWLKDGVVHDVDGAFVARLAELYDDDYWQLFDPETSKIRVTDTLESCEAAARPDVDPDYYNYCVQCLPEYMAEGATMTYVIPLEPQVSDQSAPPNFSGSGVAYNGVRLDGPAPVDDILAAHTIAPFDDCGGHVNTHVGYHIHAVTDCLQGTEPVDGHASQIGIAMDGHGIFTHLLADGTAPTGLDSCNGHATDAQGYHYHAGAAGSNAILGCLTAETGCALEDPNGICDASARPSRPPRK